MNDVLSPSKIGSLDELENTARDAAAQLTRASGENAVWDKALKALRPVLAGLPGVRTEAEKGTAETDDFIKKLKGDYPDESRESVQAAKDAVDNAIEALNQIMVKKLDTDENSLTNVKKAAADAQIALDKSIAKFDAAQNELLELPRKIQDGKKAIAALIAKVNDAHEKKQKFEAVLYLQELETMLGNFKTDITPKHETDLWNVLDAAARDVLQKTKELQDSQDKIPPAWQDYNDAKTRYEDAQKNRLEDIKTQAEKIGQANAQKAGKSPKSKT